MLYRPWVWLAGGLALLLALPVAWYLLSPLWITRAVSEPLPTAQPASAAVATQPLPTSTPALPTALSTSAPASATPANTGLSTTEVPPTATPPVTPTPATVTLAQGAFYNIVHEGEGQASIYQLADGLRVLRFESFTVLNGPDLYVYLVPADPVPNVIGQDYMVFHNLGALKGNTGDQNYELPADLDLSLYKSVVIWCRAFKVPFAAAPLAPTGG
jgi:hypothetical protein